MIHKIKEALNKTLNSKLFIVLIGIILFIKTIFFYANTIDNNVKISGYFGTFAFIFTLSCFLSILPNKIRIATAIIIDLLISILLCSDNLYYIYSSSVTSVAQISNLQYSEQIMATLPELIEFKHKIIYFIDILVILIMLLTKIIKIEKQETLNKKQIIINYTIAIVGILIFRLVNIRYIKNGIENSYNKDLQLAEATIYGYHISDVINTINYQKNTKYKTYDEMIENYNELKQKYAENYSQEQYEFRGTLENKNIIIVQLESIQEFVRNKTINGKEITPNLNKFLDENIEFTNMHMQSYSTTADSEFSTVTSLYPMENGMSFSKYYTNSYDNIFKIFNNAKYNTSYMHGNYSYFWNRENVYSRMELDNLIFKPDFEDVSENINGDLSDELLYRQAVIKLKNSKKPFMSYIVAASSHTPYTLNGIIDKEQKINIDVGEYKNTYFGNYLEAANYADYAFGILIDELKKEGLYNNTAILVFGDHNGLTMYNDEMLEFLGELNDVDVKLNYTRVLCGMKIPGVEQNLEIGKPINKLDIKPTLCYLFNIEDGFSLGTNFFESKDFICLNNERIISEKYYYDDRWYYIETGDVVDFNNISDEEKQKVNCYYENMKRELDISFSVNVNDLLK